MEKIKRVMSNHKKSHPSISLILLSITTTKGADWKERIKEAEELGIEEIALFPTCLSKDQRKNLYQLLKDSNVKSIPYCHLRSDMELWELDYLAENYGTRAFSMHRQIEWPLIYDYSKYKDIIYIESVYHPFDEEELKNFGGICLDFSHLENDRILSKELFEQNVKTIERNYIGLNHISCVKKTSWIDNMGKIRYDRHHFDNLSEFEYLKRYPKNYFSSLIVIELENSLKEQLKVKDYINNLLSDRRRMLHPSSPSSLPFTEA